MRNIAGHLKDASEFIQRRAVRNFFRADKEYGERIASLLQQYKVSSYSDIQSEHVIPELP